MEMFNNLFQWTNTLHPIIQGVIGSVIFAILLWGGRKLYTLFVSFRKDWRETNQFFEVYKIIQELYDGLSWLNPKWRHKDLNKYDSKMVEDVRTVLSYHINKNN